MTLPLKTSKEDFLRHYVQLINSLVNLSPREQDVIVAMIEESGNGECSSKVMRKVRSRLRVNHGYMSPMLSRIRNKGGVTLERAAGARNGTWKVNPWFVPGDNTELTFKFVHQ